MIKKCLLALVIMAVAAGGVFAQTDFETMPKNTIVIDIGPTIIGAAFSNASSLMGGDEGVESSGFGIAGQYERQLLEQLTVAGKIGFLQAGAGASSGDSKVNIDITSFTIEAHVRYYFGDTFFLDGMLGYANMALNIKGEFSGIDENTGIKRTEKESISIPRNYFNLGAKIGWRIDFGNSGGFVFEPSLGWYGCIGLGDTIGTGLTKELRSKGLTDVDLGEMDPLFQMMEEFIFVGGPRFTLSFGWRF